MSGDIGDISGAVSDAVTGAALAGAVEPAADGVKPTDEDTKTGTACLNCGTAIIGNHCHHCGQKAHIHRTLTAFMHDLVHGVLHFEGKMWRTLPLLMFKPGQLTRRYIEGQRARFVSPMAMFLFTVFAMFAVFQLAGLSVPTSFDGEKNLNQAAELMLEETKESVEKTRQKLDRMGADAPEREETEAELAELEKGLAGLREMQNLNFREKSSMNVNATGIAAIDEGLIKKWRENPSLMLYKLQTNGYKFSWLLIPLSIPFVWLLFFWKRRFKAYDHAIFVTYSLAFMSFLFLTLSLLGIVGAPIPAIVLAGIFIPPVHIYKQLKYGYELSRFGAFWRTAALTNMIVFIVIILFLWLLLLLGAL